MFTYSGLDGIQDAVSNWNTRNGNAIQRLGGAGQAAGGAAAVALGTFGCPESMGAGCLLAIWGADQLQAGNRTLESGQQQATVGGYLISKTGISPEYSEALYSLIGFVPAGGASAVGRASSGLTIKNVDVVNAVIDPVDDLSRLKPTTTYFRVEGGGVGSATSQNRITVNADRTISINPGCSGQLCVSVGNADHAVYYLTNKRPDGSVVVFEVDASLHNEIMSRAVPQQPVPGAFRDPSAPKVVDPTTPGTSLELPKMWESLLEKHSSGACVYSQSEFLKEFGNGSK
ncbi:hypothetical protein NRY95_00990 [Xanthomonas campestris pv. phormiicola]|nr:hypothetical protein [Xanthomonas campestris pv. phormiicola]UYC16590.1 hypothetical protein NRY95_00990 [Xanthomonas campestris pv. phormiicola]